MHLRTQSGELKFFALATPGPRSQPPPEESLCGEEALRAMGYTDQEIAASVRAEDDLTFAELTGFTPGFDGWGVWGRVMGRNSKKHVLKALALVGGSLGGIGVGMLKEAEKAMAAHGSPPLTQREKLLITGFVRAQQKAIAECAK